MKYLTPDYWRNLNINNLSKNDGIAFENLVSDILNLEYGEGRWERTSNSWDGSKDFWFFSKEKRLWAECKNYKKNISLNVLSSTLIMAQIEDIDEILIFSYSSLTKPVYEKISRFADLSNKIIRIYDDEALENIILFHQKILLPKYFPEFSIDSINIELLSPTVICSIIKDPLLAYSIEDDCSFIPYSPNSVDFNAIFCIYVSIYNRNRDVLKAQISYSWKKDAHLFEILGISSNEISIEMSSYSAISLKIYLRIINFRSKVELPYVTVKTSCKNVSFGEFKFKFKSIKCNWLGDTILIGQSYYNLLDRFIFQVINRKRFSALHLYGTSGVGKTRIINEVIALGVKNDYRIIKFNIDDCLIGDSVNATKWLIKELVYALYNIPNIDSEIDYEYIDTYKEHSHLFELLKSINDAHTDFDNKISEYTAVIADKLCSTKCFLVIDNIQYYPKNFVYFISQIFSYSIINNHKCLYVAVVSINTNQMTSNSRTMDLHLFFKQYGKSMSSIISWSLNGFSDKNESRVYLNQLLSTTTHLNEKYIEKFLERTANNPYYIKGTLNWMEINGWIKFSTNGYVVTDYSKLYKGIDMLPDNLEDVIGKNWDYLRENDTIYDSYLLIISIIHFYGKIDYSLIQEFDIDELAIKNLETRNFIKRSKKNRTEYFFYHDIIEDYFCKNYYPLSIIAAERYIQLGIHTKNLLIQQKYIDLIQLTHSVSAINNISYYHIIDDIPSKWRSEYIDLLIKYHIIYIYQCNNKSIWIELSTSLCSKIREYEGTHEALIAFDDIYNILKSKEDLFQSKTFGWFCVTYCNVLYEADRVEDAIHFMDEYLKKHHWNMNDYDDNKIHGYVLNRLHVYKRYLVNIPFENKDVVNYLEQSNNISLIHNDDEIKYINLIDYALCVYSTVEYKQFLLFNLRQACEIFEKGNIPQKTMNHIQTQILIALIDQDCSKVIKLCEYGISYVVNGQFAYYKGYFTEKFYLYLASAYLIQGDSLSAESAIAEAIEIDSLMSLRVQWVILWLQSIKHYLDCDYVEASIYLEQTYEALKKCPKKTFKDFFLRDICSNYRIIAAEYYKSTGYIPKTSIATFKKINTEIQCIPIKDIETHINNIKSTSVISSSNQKFNFPCF